MWSKRFATALLERAIVALMAISPVTASAQQTSVDTIVKEAGAPLRAGLGQLVYDGVTIGQLEGAPEYTFTNIAQIVVGSEGYVYVLDAPALGTSLLRQYDANGKYVRTIGRVGDGPGEFHRATGMALLPDGRLMVLDPLHGRINLYSKNGQPQSSWGGRYQVLIGSTYQPVTVSPAGVIAIVQRPPVSREQRMAGIDARIIIRLRANGTVLDTLRPPKVAQVAPPNVCKRHEIEGRGTSTFGTTVPYLPNGMWFWSPLGYFVTARNDRYAIDLVQPGKPVLRISRRVAPVAVSADERTDQKRVRQQLLDRRPGRQIGTLPDVPPVKPFFDYVSFDADGRLFVWVATPSERFDPPERRGPDGQVFPEARWRSPRHFDVFNPDGTYVGQFAAPYDVAIRFMRGDQVWGVVRDDLDVQYIKRFRIVWAN